MKELGQLTQEPRRRFGDPVVPRWASERVERIGIPVIAVIIPMVVFLGAVLLWRALTLGDINSRIGTIAGTSLLVIALVASPTVWVLYWRPLRKKVAAAKSNGSPKLVVGGRLPSLTDEQLLRAWPSHLAPAQHSKNVVVTVDGDGVRIVGGSGDGHELLAHFEWAQVVEIAAAEYVEQGRAYDGLVIVGPTLASAIAIQPIDTSRLFPWFTTGNGLRALAESAESYRSIPPSKG